MEKNERENHEMIPGGLEQPKKSGQPVTDELFRLMVESVKDYAIFMLDRDGCVSSWNSGAERIKGYSAEEIVGKHYSVFFLEEEIEAGAPGRNLENALANGRSETEGWRVRKDGSRFWAKVSITAIKDRNGNPGGFVKVVHDATEHRNADLLLQKSRDMFENLFENAPDAIVVVDVDGTIRKVNRHCEALFGYLRKELVGQKIETLIPERFRNIHRQHRRDYFTNPRQRTMGAGMELLARNRERGEIPVDIMLSPIDSGVGIWALAVVRDVTLRKQNEAKIVELNNSLKKQVEQQAAANRELETFSYSVSHDLRAPLRHIIGFVELLNKTNHESLDKKSQHYLEVISDSARKMGVLIDDLLAFSRMGRAEMMKTHVDLGALAREVASELLEGEKGRNIDLEIGALPVIVGDRSMLRLVLVNLLTNALKFTRMRPRARIEIGALSNGRQDEMFFIVRDNGAGFDMKYADKLFGLFQRLHSTEDFEGTGVGLANIQRIIHRHGGRVWAESAVDKGATFWFSLPKTVKLER